MPWVRVYRCATCKESLSFYEKMSSNAVCPHCGTLTPNSTIVNTKDEAVFVEGWWTRFTRFIRGLKK